MFHGAARSEDVSVLDAAPLALIPASPPPVITAPVPRVSNRYGDRRSINLPAIAAILLIHALGIVAIMQVRQHAIERREAHLSVVNLTPPPPPPAAAVEPPPPAQPQVVAPPPLIHVPTPPVQVTTPVPPPVTTPVIAAPAPPITTAAPAAVSAPPSTMQSNDLSTRMLSGKPPRYPVESRRKREQGTVVLSLTLGLDGRVSIITIAKSSGFARLDDAARDAVRGWRWAPTIRDGQAVLVRGLVEIPFQLQG